MRAQYKTRTIRLVGQQQKDVALAAIENAPIDPDKPLEVVIREEKKTRRPDQNEAMWAGPLRDIAEQAWVEGRLFTAPVWHEHFKEKYLPEDDDEELPILAKDGYHKWDYTPSGRRVLIGSTTQLTVKGFARYMHMLEADGAGMGVVFHTPPVRQVA